MPIETGLQLSEGIYEEVISIALEKGLEMLPAKDFDICRDDISFASSAQVLSGHVARILEAGLRIIAENLNDEAVTLKQIEVCNEIIALLSERTGDDSILNWKIGEKAQQLLAIWNRLSNKYSDRTNANIRPLTSVSSSALFTGSGQEPSIGSEIKKEILTSDRIDLLVSFIKWSGLRLIIDELRRFTSHGKLRVITTCYMGATDIKCVRELSSLPNTEVKVNYDTTRTRLHAKAYIFWRDSGFSTAYIGSSNISSPALDGGVEWNIKASMDDLPDIFRGVQAAFDTYWNDEEFVTFTKDQETRLLAALKQQHATDALSYEPLFVIEPFPFQKQILDKLEAERQIHGKFRNLVVAATGTGKTVVSAFDFKRYRRSNPSFQPKLLFIAHRHDILSQSIRCYRNVLMDQNFGEMFDGQNEPSNKDNLFASVQILCSKDYFKKIPRDFYDFIVIDEFHHSAAKSYRKLLEHFSPKILLGLTATPERMDGQDICNDFFDGRIAAEIRLPEAINRHLLVPFHYFGVTDSVDVSDVEFTRGHYDIKALDSRYIGNDMRVQLIADAIRKYVSDLDKVIGLGFCVSVEHARYMAQKFNEIGIPSRALDARSPHADRSDARKELKSGKIRFIFTVDLYNEGVDIPEVNTVLFLRPTESLTIFLQQLGRGLRLFEDKDALTVLDFISLANKEYDYEGKFRVLLSKMGSSLKEEVEKGFPTIPKGCCIQLEQRAQGIVLDNIRAAIVTKSSIIRRLALYRSDGNPPSLSEFLRMNPSIKVEDIYKRGTFSSLCREAGFSLDVPSLSGVILKDAFFRIQQINSRRLIGFMLSVFQGTHPSGFTIEEERMLMMFGYSVWQDSAASIGITSPFGMIKPFIDSPLLKKEIVELLDLRAKQIDFVDKIVPLAFVCPLDLHCRYSTDQILSAVGKYSIEERNRHREGVLYLEEYDTDLLFVSLLKDESDFSPSTMYRDYAISPKLFHWQSQSTTSLNSSTGIRYLSRSRESNRGRKVLLFVRESKRDEHGKPLPYIYLGPVNYVRASGSRPISIEWELEYEMPASFSRIAMQAADNW